MQEIKRKKNCKLKKKNANLRSIEKQVQYLEVRVKIVWFFPMI